jgi:NADPH-dependent curcumin reductase CurA
MATMFKGQVTRGISLVTTPSGAPQREHFILREEHVPFPKTGELLISAVMVSVDPYLVMAIRNGTFIEGRIRSRIIARVEQSNAEGFEVGDLVLGFARWQERDCVAATDMRRLNPVIPLSAYLGIAGHSGFTAMIGMALLDPQPGQTLVVSSAGGMVGLIACQLAQAAGARVVAIASKEKAAHVAALYNLAAGLDHSAEDFVDQLARACPDGIDRHFENVGARILDPVLALASPAARIALCGLIQHYGDDTPVALANFRQILTKSISILPFSIYRHEADLPAALAKLEAMVAAGQLHAPETIHDGFERLPDAFIAMLAGDGIGKHLVQVSR